MSDLKKMLTEEIILLDGATGSNLQQAGMPSGVCPELWILEHEEVLLSLQKAYVKAGSQIIYAPTFSGNAIKLAEYKAAERLEEINRRLVALSRQAAGADCLVAGDLTMTGVSLAPLGELDFEELVDCYKQQVQAIHKEGVDLFVVETMMSVQETRAAVLAVKEVTDLPVFVTLTLEENGRTLYGTDPVTALITFQALGVDAFGLNCSAGPDKLIPIFREMADYARIPLIAKPNAGLPRLINGKTTFDMPKEVFASYMKELVLAGATVVGGCCGTNPGYIAGLKAEIADLSVPKERRPAAIAKAKKRILTSERKKVEFTLDGPFHIIGERINPTGKKELQQALQNGDLDVAADMALEQKEQGASVLDINVGMAGIDEAATMLRVLEEVASAVDLPLCLDSSNPEVIKAALRRYPGRALVNSVTCEADKIDDLLKTVKKYGAMFILLPLTGHGMPKDLQERKENIDYVLKRAYALGFDKEDIIVDGLVATIGADKNAARDTLATIAFCQKEGLATACGLSNISFGLPERVYVNSVFLGMAIAAGLTMAIANPSQALFKRSALAADLLMGKENAAVRYVENCKSLRVSEKGAQAETAGKKEQADHTAALKEALWEDVIKGRDKQIEATITSALTGGCAAVELLNQVLIPAINQVGVYFNEQEYFLPQLILSAQAMERGVALLEPMLQSGQKQLAGPIVVLATVKGDIHDIGKNLVGMMMKNHGMQVIDLGKDVDQEVIIRTAEDAQADIIGLSALMTTTMSYMKEVIKAARERGLTAKIIVGGAALTAEYAKEIGADGYSVDAVAAVELVKNLTNR